MTVPHGIALLLSALLAIANSPTAYAAADADDAYLQHLIGNWDMTGKMGSKALHYRASAERVLQDGFVKLHMIDASKEPKYEADVYIGVDHQRHDFVVHWLDRFGAEGARVTGTGTRADARLIVVFPYASGNFRDTFTYVPDSDTWSLLLESQETDGKWSTFATYSMAHIH